MKRWIIIALTLAWTAVQAQDIVRDSIAADTTDTEENVIGARPSPRAKGEKKERNILGTPVYYDRNGNVIGTSRPARKEYHMPRHHYMNNMKHYCNSYFVECKGLFGSDYAAGVAFTYLPDRWGIYGSWMANKFRSYVTVGPALRLSSADSKMDLQVYGGLMYTRRVGAEVGLRISGLKDKHNYSLISGTVGMAYIGNVGYITTGISLELTAACLLGILVF